MSGSLDQGDWSWSFLGHTGVLAALTVGGLRATPRRIESLLLS